MLTSLGKKAIYRYSLVRTVVAVFEFLAKRPLATLLWIIWQSGLYPFGFVRGKGYTPGRRYIDVFLKKHASDCQGAFLEFGAPEYRSLFPSENVTRYDIIDIQPRPTVTIVADIQNCPIIPDDTYDVIVCTQVLEHVQNPFLAAEELYRILKPAGQLLLTVPAAYPYHADPHDYWRFTKDSVLLLFGTRFRDVTITCYGNRLVAVGTYWFWMQDHFPQRALWKEDPNNPTHITLYARK